MAWGPVRYLFFHHNSNTLAILFCFHLDSNKVLTVKICIWCDSCAVMACAKFCCDLMANDWITARRNFHWIWIVSKKSLVKWALAYHIEAETKWPPFRRQRFQMHFIERKWTIFAYDFIKSVPNVPINILTAHPHCRDPQVPSCFVHPLTSC